MNEIIIKQLTTENWKILRDIRLEALKIEPASFTTKYEEMVDKDEDYWRERLNDKNSKFFVPINNAIAIGLIRITLNDNEFPEDTGYIGSLYVSKDFRRMGIATRLMNTAISSVPKNITRCVLSVRESQKDAINLYTKLGFSTFETKVVSENGNDINEFYIEKLIDVK